MNLELRGKKRFGSLWKINLNIFGTSWHLKPWDGLSWHVGNKQKEGINDCTLGHTNICRQMRRYSKKDWEGATSSFQYKHEGKSLTRF